jgi:hypothetical protein
MPDPSFILPLLLQSLLIPAVVCGALLLMFNSSHRAWPVPLAIAAGFLASYIATYRAQWSFPPHQALDWLPVALLLALGAIRVERSGRLPLRMALALLVAAVVATPALGSAGATKTVVTIGIVALLMTACWSALAHAAPRRPTPPLLLAMVAGGAGLALLIDASQLIGQLCGALGVAVGAAGLLLRRRLPEGFGAAAAGVAVLLLGALLAYAHIYAGFGLGLVLLLAAAFIADPLMALLRHPAAWLASAVLAALPVAAAVGLAVKAMQDSGGY